MSRSYKHTPRAGDKKSRFYKRYANRRLRRKPLVDNLYQHKSYKKDYHYYDIMDYEDVGTTFEQFYRQSVRMWHIWGRFHKENPPTREECWENYQKWYVRK